MPHPEKLLDARLARLEGQLRWLYLAIALGAGLLLAAAFPSQEPAGPLRTTDLQLVDSAGNLLARLTPAPGGAALTLFDAAGRARISLHHDTAETALFLYDSARTIRVGLAQFAHGGGGLALHGPNARGAAVLYFKNQGTLTFYGDSGQRLLQLPSPSR